MNQQPIKKDFFIYIGVFFLLILLTVLAPFLAGIFLFLLPIPIILLMKEYPLKWTALAIGIMFLFSLLVFPFLSVPLTIIAFISGGMIGWSITKQQHPYEIWAKGTAGFVLGLVFVYAYIEVVLQFSIMENFEKTIDESLKMTEGLFQSVGMGQQDFEIIREQMMNTLQLMPVILVVVSMALAILTQWLSFKVMNKWYKEKFYFPAFRKLQLPKIILWIYFFTLIISLFVADDYSTLASVVVWNIYHLAGILIALQGLSFIFFYSHTKGQSMALPIISVLFVVFFPLIGLYLIRILGIIDLGFELRKRMAK
ncbi:YybS family protein [Gracilibacillus massiliensis]|uniref:YybS family protein n=1 Tax=Gracilibacillus massiliensis TaxID=1564956 RepID=UPI00071DB24C|nr:DUF2232 domain-containing protein [Gracilibacillus massiliensis]